MLLPNWEDKTILIVEDDDISMEFLTELLASSKANIITARDGRQAVNMCFEIENIDVVLMDVRLPMLSGKEAMDEIKIKRPTLPFIAQTAFAMSDDREKYLQVGFDDYISKPILIDNLIEKINRLFNSK